MDVRRVLMKMQELILFPALAVVSIGLVSLDFVPLHSGPLILVDEVFVILIDSATVWLLEPGRLLLSLGLERRRTSVQNRRNTLSHLPQSISIPIS